MKPIKPDDTKAQAAYKKQLLSEIEAASKTQHSDVLKRGQDKLKQFVDWQSQNQLQEFKKSTQRTVVPGPQPSHQKSEEESHASQMKGLREALEHYKLELRKPQIQPKDSDMKPRFENYYTPFPNRFTPSKDGEFSDEYWGGGQGKWTKPII